MQRKWCMSLVTRTLWWRRPLGISNPALLLRTGNRELRALREPQTAQCGQSLSTHAPAGNQHLKILSHADRGDQMFELKRNFRALLRDAAVFEGVGELIFLANAHQKLRLREQLLDPHAGLLAGSGERGEIDVGGEILLARSLVGVEAGGVLAIRHERAAMANRELFVAGVTVIDDQ